MNIKKIKRWAKGVWLAILGKQLLNPLSHTLGEKQEATVGY